MAEKWVDGGEGGEEIWHPAVAFQKNVSSKENLKPCFFVTFNIMLIHIFAEKFIGYSQIIQKI